MKTIFIGPFGNGRVPDNGASIKNFHILNRLRPLIPDLIALDTDGWKKRPILLLRILWTILRNPKGRYILSLNNDSANKIIRLLKSIAPNANVVYWVIGGSIGKWINDRKVSASDYAWLQNIIVEGESMKTQMAAAGLSNVSVMPNFKSFKDLPSMVSHKKNDILKFVFISRINVDKGCSLLLNAVESLNSAGYEHRFTVDFYGPVEDNYLEEFKLKINAIPNATYRRFLDLRDKLNYSVLAEYDAMIFPTFWHGEGCPGIVIDAYICGLPILASDWNLNGDYIIHNHTGYLFEPKSVEAIADSLLKCITGEIDLEVLRAGALKAKHRYDIEEVLSISNLSINRLIDA